MGKHTPGEWGWIKESFERGIVRYVVLKSGDEYVLAPRFNSHGGAWVQVSDEDAPLIAAAPAMLEALKAARKRIYVEMTHTIERAVLEEMSEELRQIDAALAAAEPETEADKP